MKKGFLVDNLSVEVKTAKGWEVFVRDFSLKLGTGKVMGIVGESGSGKSITAKAIARLLPSTIRIGSGQARLDGESILDMKDAAYNHNIRGRRIGFVPQNPMTSLNPSLTIGEQLMDGYRIHFPNEPKSSVRQWAFELLEQVGIQDPHRVFNEYPHRLSGGMRQRVIIAAAMMCRPELLIADEPTTALDVSVQAQIIKVLNDFRLQYGLSLLIISHDLGLLGQICDEITVMYAGRIVEQAGAVQIFQSSAHPYTNALFQATPSLHTTLSDMKGIPGIVQAHPSAVSGCVFYPRCPRRSELCANMEPPMLTVSASDEMPHRTACHFPLPVSTKGAGIDAKSSILA